MSTSNTYESARTTARNIEDEVSRAGSDLAGQVSDAAGKAQREAQFQIDKLSSSIQQKPLQSAAIAAGIGFMFAVLARR